MSILYFLEVQTTVDNCPPLTSVELDKMAASAKLLPGLESLYLFTLADGGNDPFLKDEYPPLVVLQAVFGDETRFKETLASSELRTLTAQLAEITGVGSRLVQEAFVLDPYLSSDTATGHADLSYLVNYTRPAENETIFLEYYRAHHPAILLNFPEIRRVELGLPFDWSPGIDVARADRMLYCEVSFDSIDMLNAALNSDVRAELRRDYECFPPFSGPVTHFAMHRRALL